MLIYIKQDNLIDLIRWKIVRFFLRARETINWTGAVALANTTSAVTAIAIAVAIAVVHMKQF